MNIFGLRDRVIKDYSAYVRSFLEIRDERIHDHVDHAMQDGYLWPEPLVQLNPAFEPGESLADLVSAGVLHPECPPIFADKDEQGTIRKPFRLRRHQVESIRAARAGKNRPLSFLESHIQVGNSLLGATPMLMEKGIPDEAFEPIEGDDRKTATALKKRNKQAATGQRSLETLWSKPADAEAQALARAVAELEAGSDASADELDRKEARWATILGSAEYRHQKLVADAWSAAFVWPKQPGDLATAAPTNELWRQVRDAQGEPSALTTTTVAALADQYALFQWYLQFPQVFARGGFDCVLGNPPWERIKLQEQEFFASHAPAIAGAPNAAARKKLIAKLPETDATLWAAWCAALRKSEGESRLVRATGRYPLCGKGDVNTYAIFAEHNRSLLAPGGRAGFIVPSGIATDDTTKDYFNSLVSEARLHSLYDFRNHDGLFYDVGHRRFKFCLLTVAGRALPAPAEFVFFAESPAHLKDTERSFTLSAADIELLNPNTKTCPTFRSRRDAEINKAIYRRVPILLREGTEGRPDDNPWGVRFLAMLHMANDSGIFRTRDVLEKDGWRLRGNVFERGEERMLPLYEAKMVHHYGHRFGDYRDKPAGSQDTQLPDVPEERVQDPGYRPLSRYWVPQSEVAERLEGRWDRGWLLGWRDICRSSDVRTVIAAVIPRLGVGHPFPLFLPSESSVGVADCLLGNLSSFVLDYASRQKVGGTHLTFGPLQQLPVLPPEAYERQCPWDAEATVADWIRLRVLELTYTAWDLAPFARDCGYDVPPFRWDGERRFWLRAELDAAWFHLYGIDRDDVEYIMDSFWIVRAQDEKAHGRYRTKEAILDLYDRLTVAAATGRPYVPAIEPPPADARVRTDRSPTAEATSP